MKGAPTFCSELGEEDRPELVVEASPLYVIDLGDHCRLPETSLSAVKVERHLDGANRVCLKKLTMPP